MNLLIDNRWSRGAVKQARKAATTRRDSGKP
jgi:hypothetical protein